MSYSSNNHLWYDLGACNCRFKQDDLLFLAENQVFSVGTKPHLLFLLADSIGTQILVR